MKVMVVLGTRPEIIKLSPVIRELENKKINYILVHTDQHYSKEMSDIFFDKLELKKPDYSLGVGSKSHAEQTAKMLIEIEKAIIKENPTHLIVQGDTNSVLAGALAAVKMKVKIGHVEAGLRSYDRDMPEEINRIITDHISDYLFAPTEIAQQNIIREGIDKNKVFVTGNTIVDAVNQNIKIAQKKSKFLKENGLKENEYALVTLHRPSNVDKEENIKEIIKGLGEVSKELKINIIWPIHPRTKKMIDDFKINVPKEIRLIEPIDFFDFLVAEKNAKIVLSDSGGVQEECCILKVPCVTIRDNTERPETVEVGANILAGNRSHKILECTKKMIKVNRNWTNPLGEGEASRKIVEALER